MTLTTKSGIAIAIAAACSMGCVGSLRAACVETAPARGSAASLVDDAQTCLDQALFAIFKIEDRDARARAIEALEAAHAKLRKVQSTLEGLESACASPDIESLFSEFVKAWKVLAPFIALLGKQPDGQEEGTIVPPPLVVGMLP